MSARGFGTFSLIEFRLLLREPTVAFFTVALPILLFVVFSEIFGNAPNADTPGAGQIDAHMGAYLALMVTSIGLVAVPARLAGYREAGVLRRFRAANVSRGAILASQLLSTAVLATLSAVLMVAIAWILFRPAAPDSPLLVAAGLVFGTLVAWAFGCLLGAIMPGARSAQTLGLGIYFVTLLLGGAGPPRSILPAFLRSASDVLPTTHVVPIIQSAWLGLAGQPIEWLILAAFLAGSAALAFVFFRWE